MEGRKKKEKEAPIKRYIYNSLHQPTSPDTTIFCTTTSTTYLTATYYTHYTRYVSPGPSKHAAEVGLSARHHRMPDWTRQSKISLFPATDLQLTIYKNRLTSLNSPWCLATRTSAAHKTATTVSAASISRASAASPWLWQAARSSTTRTDG